MSRISTWRCKKCGAPIGWLGKAVEFLLGPLHRCRWWEQ